MKQTTQTQEKRFNDMRGEGFAGNYINLYRDKPYYCGSPIQDLIKDATGKSNYYWNIIQYGVNVATIALRENDSKELLNLLHPIDFTRINCDTNGNSRFVCHFLAFIGEKDRDIELSQKYELALKRSRQLGGKKFHNKQYGGGIVFQMYKDDIQEMSRKIREIANS